MPHGTLAAKSDSIEGSWKMPEGRSANWSSNCAGRRVGLKSWSAKTPAGLPHRDASRTRVPRVRLQQGQRVRQTPRRVQSPLQARRLLQPAHQNRRSLRQPRLVQHRRPSGDSSQAIDQFPAPCAVRKEKTTSGSRISRRK